MKTVCSMLFISLCNILLNQKTRYIHRKSDLFSHRRIQSDAKWVISSITAAPRVSPDEKCWLSLLSALFFVPPAENREVEYYFSVPGQIACGMILSSKNQLAGQEHNVEVMRLCYRSVYWSTRVVMLVYPSPSLLSGLFTIRLNEK